MEQMVRGFDDAMAARYFVDDLASAHQIGSMLYTILRAMDDGELISDARRQWLEKKGLNTLADLATGKIDHNAFCVHAAAERQVRIPTAANDVDRVAQAEQSRREVADARHEAERARLKALSDAYFNDPVRRRKLEWERLRRRFDTGYIQPQYYPRVMKLLAQLATGQRLSPSDALWFQTEGRGYWSEEAWRVWNSIEAESYADEWRRTGEAHKAAKASACWRKAEKAGDALTITEAALAKSSGNAKAQSMLMTTRGGAMRDLRRFEEALVQGQNAHALTPKNFHPCTLLGAVHIQLGNHVEGLRWYTMAEERGAKVAEVDQDLRSVWRRLNEDEKKGLGAVLLARDSVRYAWVKRRQRSPQRKAK